MTWAKLRWTCCLPILVIPWATPGAGAADYCVRAGATGVEDGSDWANAYPALPPTLARGATYYLAAGDYPGTTFETAAEGTTPITIKRATIGDHGASAGWDDSYAAGQATFGGMLEFTSAYWVIDGQTGGGAANGWDQALGFKVVEAGDGSALLRVNYSGAAHHITIRHVELQGKGSVSDQGGSYSNDGLAVYGGARDVTLTYFWMHGIGRCPFFLSAIDLVAEHGWVASFFGSGAVHSEVASIWGTVGDMTFRYNLITDIQSTGGLMWDNSQDPGAHLYVYGNVFYKPAGADWGEANGLIGGWTGGNGEEFHNAWVYNNTFINVDQQCLSTFPNIASGNIAVNNLFYNCASPDFAKFENHDSNHFINAGGAHGEPNGTSAPSGDPFADFTGRDFRLIAATGAGATLTAPFDRDPLGVARGGDGAWDRGAFEYGGADEVPPSPPANLKVR